MNTRLVVLFATACGLYVAASETSPKTGCSLPACTSSPGAALQPAPKAAATSAHDTNPRVNAFTVCLSRAGDANAPQHITHRAFDFEKQRGADSLHAFCG